MGTRSYIVSLLGIIAMMMLVGCGAKQEAKAPETNPWADYKGTFAPGAPATLETKTTTSAEEPKVASAPSEDSKPAATAEAKPAKEPKKTAKEAAREAKEAKAQKVAEAKAARAAEKAEKAAEKAPEKTADPPAKTAEAKVDTSATDARAMYGVETTMKPDEESASAPAPKKVPKKRAVAGAGGKKPGAKKGTRAKR